MRKQHDNPEIAKSLKVVQHIVDVFDPKTYRHFISDHKLAFNTFGVGQPSQVSRDQYVKTDLDCAQNFAIECKEKGVQHFSSLGAVGANINSKLFYLRVKTQLEDRLKDLKFDRLILFRPSIIVTPKNRYGFSQALTLQFYPWLDPLLRGSFNQYRSIKVETLGQAMALNAFKKSTEPVEILTWKKFLLQ